MGRGSGPIRAPQDHNAGHEDPQTDSQHPEEPDDQGDHREHDTGPAEPDRQHVAGDDRYSGGREEQRELLLSARRLLGRDVPVHPVDHLVQLDFAIGQMLVLVIR